jgi:arginine deiminase
MTRPDREGVRVSRNHSMRDAVAGARVDNVTLLSTGEDLRAAKREQWADGTNYLAVAPGVVMGL